MATINDIAKMAGVSTSTVSHVVNKTRYVSPEKVEKVEKAIRELDTPPNFVLKKTLPHMPEIKEKYILMLIADKKSSFQRRVEQQIDEGLRDTGYSLITIECNSDISGMKSFFDVLLAGNMVTGIIVFPDEKDILIQRVLLDVKVPVIVLGREVRNFMADTICTDTLDGAYKATKHLINKGHERIGFLGRSRERSPKRLEGFKKALREYHIPELSEYIYPHLQKEQDIFEALDELLSGEQMPTALIVANYAVVIPFLKYIDAHNITCPTDISVVCFGSFDWAPLHTPALTTVEQDTEQYVKLTVETLLQRIANKEYANVPAYKNVYRTVMLQTKLVVRSSTCGIGRGPFGEKASSMSELVLSEAEIQNIRYKKLTAAISFHYAGKAWMELHQKGIRDIFDNLGISIIAITDAHFDPQLQCRQLDSLRMLEPDILIAIPTDNKLTADAFRKIADRGIKLILITNVPDGLRPEDYVTCVSINEHSHGQNMGHGLGEYMYQHNMKNYGLIVHGADFYATIQRDNAAKQVISEEYPVLHLCEEIRFEKEDEVYKKTKDLIKRYPEIEALYISWDGPAMEAIAALTEMGRTDVAIVTSDLDYADAMNMAKGGMIKVLSAQCPYEQGQAIALAAAKSVLNEKVPSFIGIEPISVTPDNLLKSWKKVFKEEPGQELVQAFKENPNYVSAKE